VKEPKLAFIHQLAGEILFEELPWFQAGFWSFMEPRVLRLYRNLPIITVSQSTKESLIQIGIPGSNIYEISEGLDHNVYVLGGEKSPFPHVIYVGRIKRFKGVHHLIKAMKRVVDKLPNAKLSVVGRGDLNYEVELRQLVKSLKLVNKVVFHGYVQEKEKIRLMQEAHILVIPSQREGFGLVVLEANATGTPAIATDVLGLRNAVVKNETGLLVPYGNIEALAEAIETILTDSSLRERLSRNAVRWSKRFSWDRAATEALGIIRKVLE
jgi:glycosyltransferase involved in cell wall biosynthesis